MSAHYPPTKVTALRRLTNGFGIRLALLAKLSYTAVAAVTVIASVVKKNANLCAERKRKVNQVRFAVSLFTNVLTLKD